ncbi:MAG: hypothetical protein MUC65_09085 [Pontiellaceae bacterium]|nr:hypothetical protein [Pontiellaceae bacterium]
MFEQPSTLILEIFFFLLGAILSIFVSRMFFGSRKLRRQNVALRQEREVVFDFIHNIGEVFSSAEEMNMESLLKRILFFTAKTAKAASGVIYLFTPDRSRLFARAVSGIFPPLYDSRHHH